MSFTHPCSTHFALVMKLPTKSTNHCMRISQHKVPVTHERVVVMAQRHTRRHIRSKTRQAYVYRQDRLDQYEVWYATALCPDLTNFSSHRCHTWWYTTVSEVLYTQCTAAVSIGRVANR